MALMITGFIVAAGLLVPFLVALPFILRGLRQAERDRLVTMHGIWTELSRAFCAPAMGGFRDEPRSAYVRVATEDYEVVEAHAGEAAATARYRGEG